MVTDRDDYEQLYYVLERAVSAAGNGSLDCYLCLYYKWYGLKYDTFQESLLWQ